MTTLLIIDVQYDFLPNGALGVTDGDAIFDVIEGLAAGADQVIATRDFHPKDHVSFAEQGGPCPLIA